MALLVLDFASSMGGVRGVAEVASQIRSGLTPKPSTCLFVTQSLAGPTELVVTGVSSFKHPDL